MAKRTRGSNRPGQRHPDRHGSARPQNRPAPRPSGALSATEEARAGVMEALGHATGFVRRELGQRLELREVPGIRFEYDSSLDRGARVDEILRRIERGEVPEDEPDA